MFVGTFDEFFINQFLEPTNTSINEFANEIGVSVHEVYAFLNARSRHYLDEVIETHFHMSIGFMNDVRQDLRAVSENDYVVDQSVLAMA